MRPTRLLLPLLALAAPATQTSAQNAPNPVLASYSYADFADLAAAAPIAAGGQIRDAIRLKDAAGVPPGFVRFYVETSIQLLIRGSSGLPATVRYLVDVPLDRANRAPKLKKQRVLLLAAPVPGRPDEIQLVARDAQLPWTPDVESRLRAVLLAAAAPDAPPAVTGVGRAFHVPGAIPGESETQIFLTTADARPVSLNVLRRPGEMPRWAVALGEMVDEAAEPPARDTLLWYRLACFLPATLPPASLDSLGTADARAAEADYQLIRAGLGPCQRNRTQ